MVSKQEFSYTNAKYPLCHIYTILLKGHWSNFWANLKNVDLTDVILNWCRLRFDRKAV
jgi:hypothetical protein